MFPKVSILWLNYNSLSFIDIVLESLQAVNELDYPNYELIVVDNASTDGSHKVIKNFIGKISHAKFIRLERNLGFTGGNNVAYRLRDPESNYVVLLNNDAIPHQNILKEIIEIMENNISLGACQGVILRYGNHLIDSAGNYICEMLGCYSLFSGKHYGIMKKPLYITYADGSLSIYRIEALKRATKSSSKIFEDYTFAYFDDLILGLKLWNSNYKIASFPFIAGYHQRSTSFKKYKPLQFYLSFRGRVALNTISNSRYKNLIDLMFTKSVFFNVLSSGYRKIAAKNREEAQRVAINAYLSGKKIGQILKRKGENIDLYKAPIIKVDIHEGFWGMIIPRRLINPLIKEKLEKTLMSLQSLNTTCNISLRIDLNLRTDDVYEGTC
ncbi:MAG: glycosyltransferase [Candidatus Methanomethylicia archaeon]